MGVFEHWHPVLESRQLRKNPVGIKLDGRGICLFRDSQGRPAALDDLCPHRRLKLSVGKVLGDRLQCKYHGWTFDACGAGQSPGTPKLHACTESYEVREEHGCIWVRARGSIKGFPEIQTAKFHHLGNFYHEANVPLELALDNFTEIEHSGTVHKTFGYDTERLHEVSVRFMADPHRVRVVNQGPTKTLHPLLRCLLGVRTTDQFHDEWTTYFSPIYSVYDHWWAAPDGSRESRIRWRLYMFFWPIDPMRTAIRTFAFAQSRYPGPAGGLRIAKYFFRWAINRELAEDLAILEHLADHRATVEGMKLSRFDKVLGLTRERIARVYRGTSCSQIRLSA